MDKLYKLEIKAFASTFKNEGWPFIFICLYLFFEYVRPQSIYTAIDILPWVPIVLILVIVSSAVSGEFGRSAPSIISKLVIFFAGIVFLSIIYSQYQEVSLKSWRVFFDWLIIYFLITQLINNEKRFFIFLCLFLLFSFKMAQHGFLSWVLRGFSFAGWGITGAPGWFHNSGEVGIQMCIFVPLAVFFIIALFKYFSKFWLVACLLMPVAGIGTAIASSSRGALIGLAAAGCWSVFKRPRIFFGGGIVLGLSVIIVLQSIPEESIQRFRASGQDNTSLHRLERWKHGIEALNDFPVLGVGFNAWPEYYAAHYTPKHQGTPLVHNVFIQCGAELGYAGLAVFITLIFSNFYLTRKVRKLLREDGDQFPAIISYGLDAALVGFLMSGSFVTVLYYPYFWVHCAMVTSLHSAVVHKHQFCEEKQKKRAFPFVETIHPQ